MTSTAMSGGRGVKRSLGGEDVDELEKRRLEVREEAMAGWLGALVVFFSVFCFLFSVFFLLFVIFNLFYHSTHPDGTSFLFIRGCKSLIFRPGGRAPRGQTIGSAPATKAGVYCA